MPNPEDLFAANLLDESYEQENIYSNKTKNNKENKSNKSLNGPNLNDFRQCKVLLKEKSKLNSKILKYFKKNITDLNNNKLYFEWIAVYEEEEEYYEEQGIDKFPSMIVGNSTITGVTNIIKSLENILYGDKSDSDSDTYLPPVKRTDPNMYVETFDELYKASIDEMACTNDNDISTTDNINNRHAKNAMEFNRARDKSKSFFPPPKTQNSSSRKIDKVAKNKIPTKKQPVAKKPNRSNALDPSEIIKTIGSNDIDDKLMADHYANQLLTELEEPEIEMEMDIYISD